MRMPARLIFFRKAPSNDRGTRTHVLGRQALEIEFLKGALKAYRGREARVHPSSPALTASPYSPKDAA